MATESANIDQTLLASIVIGAIASVPPAPFSPAPIKSDADRTIVTTEDHNTWAARVLSQIPAVATTLSLKSETAKQAASVVTSKVPAADSDTAFVALALDGAIAAAGPVEPGNEDEWQARVTSLVGPVADLLSPKNDAVKTAQSILNCINGVNKSSVFVAPEVLSVRRASDVYPNDKSNRAIVTFRTDDLSRHADGTEQIRTERTDTPRGLAMCQRIRNELIGHKVVVYKELQPMNRGDGQSAKVIVHLVDLGPADATD